MNTNQPAYAPQATSAPAQATASAQATATRATARLARTHLRRAAAALFAAATAFAIATPAHATIDAITGVDYLYPDMASYEAPATESAGYVDVLAVSGDKGDVLYVDLLDADGKLMASHLAFILGDETDEAAAAKLATEPDIDSGKYVGMLSVNIDALNSSSTYTIRAYVNREGEPDTIYTGTLQVIFAQFSASAAATADAAAATTLPEPIMVRTMGETDARADAAELPQTIVRASGNADAPNIYQLTSTDPIADPEGLGRTVYAYALQDSSPASIEGHVNYYLVGDADMTPLAVDDNPAITLAKGESKTVDVPELVTAGGAYYRTLQVGNSVKLSYPGTSDASVFVKELNGNWGEGSPYVAHINYKDADGNAITPSGMTDSLVVTRPYTYTPPKQVYVQTADGIVEYTLDEAASRSTTGAVLDANSRLTFELGADDALRTADLVYTRTTEEAGAFWLVRYVNGAVGTDDAGRTIGNAFRVTEADAPGGIFTPEASKTVNGKTYVPTVKSVDLNALLGDVATVYYVPEDYEAHEPYSVTVNLKDIASGDTLRTLTGQVSLTADRSTAELTINVPARLTEGGEEYVLLSGQLTGGPDTYQLLHSYYAGEQTYTVYFRNVNDDLHQATVVTRVVTVYDDVVVTDLGTTTTGGTGTGDGTGTGTGTGAAGTTGDGTGTGSADARLGTDGGLNVIGNGGENTTLIRDDGTDVSGERIDDETTPLAGPGGITVTTASNTIFGLSRSAALGVLGSLAGVGILAFIFALRRNQEGDTNEDEQ